MATNDGLDMFFNTNTDTTTTATENTGNDDWISDFNNILPINPNIKKTGNDNWENFDDPFGNNNLEIADPFTNTVTESDTATEFVQAFSERPKDSGHDGDFLNMQNNSQIPPREKSEKIQNDIEGVHEDGKKKVHKSKDKYKYSSMDLKKAQTKILIFDPNEKIGLKFSGNRIRKIIPDTQAQKLGVQVGWSILSIDEVEMPDDKSTIKNVIKHCKNQQMTIKFSLRVIRVKFHTDPFGISYRGNVLTSIQPGTPSDQAGIIIGWRIIEINGKKQIHDSRSVERSIIDGKNKIREKNIPTVIIFQEPEKIIIPPKKVERELQRKVERQQTGSNSALRYKIGQKVIVDTRGLGTYHSAVITGVSDDSKCTYAIKYNSGLVKKNVKQECIQPDIASPRKYGHSTVKGPKYAIVSHQWEKGFVVQEVPPDENPDIFWRKQPKTYCAVMFHSEDQGQTWYQYRKRGIGAIQKILDNHLEVLSNLRRDDEPMVTVDFSSNTLGRDPWGFAYDGRRNWDQWRVLRVVSGAQADRGGVRRGDKIAAFNGRKINEENYRAVRKKLAQGVPCKITFMSPTTKTKTTTETSSTIEIIDKSVEDYKYSGYLKKHAGAGKRSQKRFFILADDSFEWYVDETLLEKKGSIPFSYMGFIDVDTNMKSGLENGSHIFKIKSQKKEYTLEADSNTSKKKWVENLRNAKRLYHENLQM